MCASCSCGRVTRSVTSWTYDEAVSETRVIPIADIHLVPDDGRPVKTIDLMGAHVLIDVDEEGNVVSIEILGPAVFTDLKDLGDYLKTPATAIVMEDGPDGSADDS